MERDKLPVYDDKRNRASEIIGRRDIREAELVKIRIVKNPIGARPVKTRKKEYL